MFKKKASKKSKAKTFHMPLSHATLAISAMTNHDAGFKVNQEAGATHMPLDLTKINAA